MIRIGLRLALLAGIADVSIALLQRPESFARPAALVPPILGFAVLVLAVYMPLAWLAGRATGAERRGAAAAALAGGLGVGIMVALLAGIQANAGLSAHTLFKGALSVTVGAALGTAIYRAFGLTSSAGPRAIGPAAALAGALPLLALEVLAAQWLVTYEVDPLFSIAGALVAAALGMCLLATLAIHLRATGRRGGDGSLAFCAAALIAVPLGGLVWPASEGIVASTEAIGRTPRRIVLVSVDTLRADALSAYRPGGTGRRTPAIDALADDGLQFELAYSPAPWTLPSLVSILTGLAPAAHQAVGFESGLGPATTTLAERLAARGYHTAAIVHNDLLSPKRGLSQGFAEYMDLTEPWFGGSVGAALLQRVLPATFPPRSWPSTADHTNTVLEWLDRNADRDFFLWIHYFDPHAPYAPPREYLAGAPPAGVSPTFAEGFEGQKVSMEGVVVPDATERRWVRELYDAEARYVDASLGRLVAWLKQRALYDDTLLVLTSDHGEEFWEHGALGHGHSMYDEVLRVPLVVKLPGARQRGVLPGPVSTVAVTPTILDLAGVPYSDQDMSSPSLRPLFDGRTAAAAPIVSTSQMLFDRRETVRFDRYRYIVSRVDGREELYDLDSDPVERQSVAPARPEEVRRGAELLQAHAAAARALAKRLGIDGPAEALDAETLRRLRSLGYVR